ncbi:MAG: methylmalonyl-CoA mutase, partial [Acidimicrobiia bacterium]|nr:methylmalonyl-CoA mutase [Acidimicrobiia bacterium]
MCLVDKDTGDDSESIYTPSGIKIEVVYDEPPDTDLIGEPGVYPFTRGPYPTMYRGKQWTMRQYAGFGTAEETNQRFHSLLQAGQ